MNDEVKTVNEFDRDGYYSEIGVNTGRQVSICADDGTKAHHDYHFPGIIQIPKGFELGRKLILQLPTSCDTAIDQGIQELK